MSLRNKKIIIPLVILGFFLSGLNPVAVFADHEPEHTFSNADTPPGEKTITPSAPTPSAAGGGQAKDFLDYAKFLYPFMLSVAAILAVVMMVFAGMQMMAAVGNPGMITSAKKRIWAAIGGLLIAVGSYLILRTINPQLVNLQLNLPQVNIRGGGQTIGGDESICTPACDSQSQNCVNGQCVNKANSALCSNPQSCNEGQCVPGGKCINGGVWNQQQCSCQSPPQENWACRQFQTGKVTGCYSSQQSCKAGCGFDASGQATGDTCVNFGTSQCSVNASGPTPTPKTGASYEWMTPQTATIQCKTPKEVVAQSACVTAIGDLPAPSAVCCRTPK